jgi:hypothetical protein
VTRLDPDELRHLLHGAVGDLSGAPDGYQRILAGIARRRRWRVPAYVVGAAVLACVALLAFFVVRQPGSSQLVEPISPVVDRTPGGTATVPPAGGSATGEPGGGGGGSRVSGGGGVSQRTSPPVGTARPSPSTTVPSPTTSPSPRPDQNSPPLPAPTQKPAKAGDIDGDGLPDTVTYSSLAGTLDVRLTRLGSKTVPLPEALTPIAVKIADLDGDGYSEILVEIGANPTTFAVVRLTADGLAVLVGGPLPLRAGSTSTKGYGFTCANDLVTVASGVSTDGITYTVTSQAWRLVGSAFQTVGAATTSSYDSQLPGASPFTASCGAS